MTLSEHTAHFGLEHHESSDNRTIERAFLTEGGRRGLAGLLAHEYVHSWNGKYRRPAGLATPNYQKPMKGELLWVYEGFTRISSAPSCRRAPACGRPTNFATTLAAIAASMDHTAGRAVAAAGRIPPSPRRSSTARRGNGRSIAAASIFTIEGTLIWLEADVIIRQQTKGESSLDDFCKKFSRRQKRPAHGEAVHV